MITIILFILYPLAIQYERGVWWRLLAPLTFVALVIDVIANHTELALLTLDFPKRGEWTFSQRLARLQFDGGWRGDMARLTISYLNHFDPDGKHV